MLVKKRVAITNYIWMLHCRENPTVTTVSHSHYGSLTQLHRSNCKQSLEIHEEKAR